MSEEEKLRQAEFLRNWHGGLQDRQAMAKAFNQPAQTGVMNAWQYLVNLFHPSIAAEQDNAYLPLKRSK